MARLARLYIPDQPQNVILRALGQQSAFVDDADYALFLECLHDALPKHGLKLHAWALLPNAVHLLVTPSGENSLPMTMQAVGRRYVAIFNRRHAPRRGTLWEGRFRATVIEPERYVVQACRFIETAPVRAGLVATPEEYRWSSFRHHAGIAVDGAITDHAAVWALGNTPIDREMAYKALIQEPLEEREIKALTDATLKGWVLGSANYREWAATKANRRISALNRGRPRKVPAAPAAPKSPADANKAVAHVGPTDA